MPSTATSSVEPEFKDWVELKGRYRIAKREQRAKEAALAAEVDRRDKLQAFVKDEKLLRERAAKRRDELAKELNTAVEERKASSKAINELLDELDLLGRITRSGQAVILARRVAHRENQWYQANWGDDASAMPATDVESGMDVVKVEAAWKKAMETQALIRELSSERERNRQLQLQLQGAPAAQPEEESAPAETIGTEAPEGQRHSLWDRIFK